MEIEEVNDELVMLEVFPECDLECWVLYFKDLYLEEKWNH